MSDVGDEASRGSTFTVRAHVVRIERFDKHQWRVTVDGRRLASYCSEARARAAGRTEARRLAFIASARW